MTIYDLLSLQASLPMLTANWDRMHVKHQLDDAITNLAPHILSLWLAVQQLELTEEESGPDETARANVRRSIENLNFAADTMKGVA